MSNNDGKRRLSRPEVSGISAIFNPRKLRRSSTAISQLLGSTGRPPSVVITDDNLSEDYGSGILGMINGPHGGRDGPGPASSLAMQGGQCAGPASSTPLLAEIQQHSGNNIVTLESSLINNPSQPPGAAPNNNNNNNNNTNLKPIAKTIATIKRAIFSKTARKLCCGVILSFIVAASWTILIHCIKRALVSRYLFNETIEVPVNFSLDGSNNNNNNNNNNNRNEYSPPEDLRIPYGGGPDNYGGPGVNYAGNLYFQPQTTTAAPATVRQPALIEREVYDAPFFTAWILTIATVLFYPVHQMTVRFCSCMGRKGPKTMSRAISDAVQGFRERGMTFFQFLSRCTTLCCLWLMTYYLIVLSLRSLRATEVLSLFATTTSFVYLLSWVVLHQQFVGLRILAVILSNMGIALFAYMDGQTHKSKTIGGVIFGALAASFAAVFKVSLKKMFGVGATISQQVAFIFSMMGIIAVVILWPIFLTLYFTGIEVIRWELVRWEFIGYVVFASLLVSMLDNFGVTCTFEFFITIGLLLAIPFTAVLDQHLYQFTFDGMRLAGIITVSIGFIVVLLPENWPDYITRLIRRLRGESAQQEEEKHQFPNSAHAHHRLSRSGLEGLLVHPSTHIHNNNNPFGSLSSSQANPHHPTPFPFLTTHNHNHNLNHHHPTAPPPVTTNNFGALALPTHQLANGNHNPYGSHNNTVTRGPPPTNTIMTTATATQPTAMIPNSVAHTTASHDVINLDNNVGSQNHFPASNLQYF